MRARLFLLSLALVFCLAVPASAAPGDGLFPDVARHWAAEPVNFLGALEIVKGYPDGTFRPERALTGVETVVLFLRATDHAPTRQDTTGLAVPPDAAWATAELALAVKEGLIRRQDITPEVLLAPAPRAFVWQMMARSMKVPPAEVELPYADAGRIPPDALPAARTLFAHGLLQGFPDGTLRPLAPVTRAEMAAFIAGMVEEGWLNPLPARRLDGWVSAVKKDKDTYKITLSTPGEGSREYALAPNCGLFNLKPLTPHALCNLRARVVLDRGSKAAYIRAGEPRVPPRATDTVTATVEKVIRGRDYQVTVRDLHHELRTFNTNWATTVPGGLAAMKTGQWVRLVTIGETAWEIDALKVEKVSGTIKSIDGYRIRLDKEHKTLGDTFEYWDRARLSDRDGNRYSGALQAESNIEIICLNAYTLLEIRVTK